MTPSAVPSASTRPARFARYLGWLVALCALLLVGAGCGGDDDTGADATDSGSSELDGSGGDGVAVTDGSGAVDGEGDPGDGSGGSSEPQPLVLAAAALPSSPLDSGVVTFVGRAPAVPPVDAVVDTCAALPASAVDAVADEASQAFSFGEEHAFTAETLGAACVYSYDTHRLTIVIGSADQVTNEPQGLFTPVAAGDITVTPWSGDASVSVFSEDSFDLDTPYGAHADAGPFGVFVANSGGTGIDYGSEGELFAELAAAAAPGSESAPEPSAEALDGPTGSATDACSLWTAHELSAALGVPVGPAEGNPGFPQVCTWKGLDEGGALVEVGMSLEGENLFDFEPMADDPRVLTNTEFGPRTKVVDGPVNVDVRVGVGTNVDPDGEAQLLLAQNISARLG